MTPLQCPLQLRHRDLDLDLDLDLLIHGRDALLQPLAFLLSFVLGVEVVENPGLGGNSIG